MGARKREKEMSKRQKSDVTGTSLAGCVMETLPFRQNPVEVAKPLLETLAEVADMPYDVCNVVLDFWFLPPGTIFCVDRSFDHANPAFAVVTNRPVQPCGIQGRLSYMCVPLRREQLHWFMKSSIHPNATPSETYEYGEVMTHLPPRYHVPRQFCHEKGKALLEDATIVDTWTISESAITPGAYYLNHGGAEVGCSTACTTAFEYRPFQPDQAAIACGPDPYDKDDEP